MPVRATTCGGMPVPGSTSVASSPTRSPPRTLTAPISVMVSRSAEPPVVSRSSTTNVTSRRGVPSSSKDSWGAGAGRGAGTVADASPGPRQFRATRDVVGPASSEWSRAATTWTGRTRLTWTDVRHVRRPAPARPGDGAGTSGRVPRPGRHRALDRAVLGQPARAGPLAAGRGRGRRRRGHAGRRRAGAAAPARPLHPGEAVPARRRRAARRDGGLRARSGPPSSPGGRSTVPGSSRRPRPTRWPPPPRPCSPRTRAPRTRWRSPPAGVRTCELRAERDEALARVDKLTSELERLRAELTDARAAGPVRGAGARSRVPAAAQARERAGRRGCAPRSTGGPRRSRRSRSCGCPRRRTWRRSPPSATGSASARRPSGAGRPTPPPRSRRPGRRRGRRGSPTRSASACCSTPSAARWRGCAASWRWAAAVRAREIWWRVRGRSAAVAPSTR